MKAKRKALELVTKYGNDSAIEIAEMIFIEHYSYSDSKAISKNEWNESYTNAEKCNYWREVVNHIRDELTHAINY